MVTTPGVATADGPRAGTITVNIPDDRTCQIYTIMSSFASENADRCGCDGDTLLCYYEDYCSQDDICADTVELMVELDSGTDGNPNGVSIKGCTDFISALEFEQTCIDFEFNAAQEITACNSVTYGGKRCKCDICGDNMSVDIDCSEFNERAKTSRCQTLPENFGPVVPTFQKTLQSRGGTGCKLYQTLESTINNMDEMCGCSADGLSLECRTFNLASGDTDAESVEMRISEGSASNKYEIENCIRFDNDNRYDVTCITTSVIRVRGDLTHDKCLGATFGGMSCQCKICDDKNGIDIDCTAFEDKVKTDGCQRYDAGQPFVADFEVAYNGDGSSATTATSRFWNMQTMILFFMAVAGAYL